MSAIRIRRDWAPGDLGWVIAEHGTYYEQHWRLGAKFEAKVAEAMGEWMTRYQPGRDLFLMASDDSGRLGSISLDATGPHAADHGARIRFFIMADRARGTGLGRRLVTETMAHIRAAGISRAWLTTFRGLDAARRLYETEGFALTEEKLDTSWGTPLHEQRFDWRG